MNSSSPRRAAGAPPTVLFLIHDLCPGGAERVYLTYLSQIRGFRVVPVLMRPRGSLAREIPAGQPIYHLEAGGALDPCSRDRSWAVDEAQPPRSDNVVGGSAALLVKSRRLVSIARLESAHVISSFLHKSHMVAIVSKLLWDRQLRVVANMHEQPVQHLETHFPPARRPLMRAYYRWLLPRADRITAVTAGVRDELVGDFEIPTSSITVTPNPIDVPALRARAAGTRISPEELPAGPGPLIVGVGRLESIKGFDLLLRAVHQARQRMPIRLILVGDGSERGRLQALVESLGLSNSVKMLGYRENPLPYVAAADLLVLPSRIDAWPTVICEAMALGTPVLATRCSPGVEELLEGGNAGHLVAPDDVDALSDGLVGLLRAPDQLDSLSRLGRVRAEQFGLRAMLDGYENALASAAPTTGKAP